MRSLRDRLKHTAARSVLYFWSLWLPDRMSDWSASRARPPELPREGKLVLAPTGGGNIGDQALLEAYLANEDGPVTVICRSESDFALPAEAESRVRLVAFPRILGPIPLGRRRELNAFRELARRAVKFSIIGADLIDGLYNPGASIARCSLLTTASAVSCPSAILGFSWSSTPVRTAKWALRRASRVGEIQARDPRSFMRLESDGMANVRLVADIVFTDPAVLAPADVREVIRDAEQSQRRVAVVNISALIEKRFSQLAGYRQILKSLIGLGYRVVLLPHVLRKSGDDLVLSRTLLARMGEPAEYHLVERLLSPRESRWVAGQADLVITGRMHLAILALMQGVPAITLSTQGKVEGLYDQFDLPDLAITADPGFAGSVVPAIEDVTRRHRDYEEQILDALPDVVSRARRSFSVRHQGG